MQDLTIKRRIHTIQVVDWGNKEMKMVQLEHLETGMVIAEPVLGDFDLVYAERGESVTEKMLERLDRLGIPFVFIEEDQPNASARLDPDRYTTEYNQTFMQCHESYNELLSVIDGVFSGFQLIDTKVIDAVKDPINTLVDNVTIDTSMLLKLKKLHSKDAYSLRHSLHVSMLSAMIAKWMNYHKSDISNIALAGLFHDIGKSQIPDQVLNKPARLDDSEYQIMKQHSELGYEMTRTLGALNQEVLRGIVEHHERADGTGYPNGLSQGQIHPYAKIVAVADVYDAMTTDRVYSKHRSPFEAIQEIKRIAFNGEIDAKVTAVFLKNIYRMFVGSFVMLNSGEIAEIVYINKVYPDSPIVRIGQSYVDLSTERQYAIVDVKF